MRGERKRYYKANAELAEKVGGKERGFNCTERTMETWGGVRDWMWPSGELAVC